MARLYLKNACFGMSGWVYWWLIDPGKKTCANQIGPIGVPYRCDVPWLCSIPIRYLAQLKQWQTWQVPWTCKFYLGMVRIYDFLSFFLSFVRSFVRSFFLLSLSLSFLLSFFPSFHLSFLPSFLPSFLLSFFLSFCLSLPLSKKTNMEHENDDFQTKCLNIWGSFIACCILVLGSASLQQYPTTGFWTYMKARQYQ